MFTSRSSSCDLLSLTLLEDDLSSELSRQSLSGNYLHFGSFASPNFLFFLDFHACTTVVCHLAFQLCKSLPFL